MFSKKATLIAFILFSLSKVFFAQEIKIDKIDPPNWWVGMKWDEVQLMIYGENLNNTLRQF
jgi:hypothetical protein